MSDEYGSTFRLYRGVHIRSLRRRSGRKCPRFCIGLRHSVAIARSRRKLGGGRGTTPARWRIEMGWGAGYEIFALASPFLGPLVTPCQPQAARGGGGMRSADASVWATQGNAARPSPPPPLTCTTPMPPPRLSNFHASAAY